MLIFLYCTLAVFPTRLLLCPVQVSWQLITGGQILQSPLLLCAVHCYSLTVPEVSAYLINNWWHLLCPVSSLGFSLLYLPPSRGFVQKFTLKYESSQIQKKQKNEVSKSCWYHTVSLYYGDTESSEQWIMPPRTRPSVVKQMILFIITLTQLVNRILIFLPPVDGNIYLKVNIVLGACGGYDSNPTLFYKGRYR